MLNPDFEHAHPEHRPGLEGSQDFHHCGILEDAVDSATVALGCQVHKKWIAR
jgi:hypothetical protein